MVRIDPLVDARHLPCESVLVHVSESGAPINHVSASARPFGRSLSLLAHLGVWVVCNLFQVCGRYVVSISIYDRAHWKARTRIVRIFNLFNMASRKGEIQVLTRCAPERKVKKRGSSTSRN